ncbi:hypothetical protein RND71_009542 [Anisodus tanguticus]|uniref:Uncharacterized protein n=1 Tax=Anisodus tanguticus TaxID=243964 RepID=A0AAE1SIH8_9SOLA|nr:hypothetical protein RND71_009542 [Anisodus tanguticus]
MAYKDKLRKKKSLNGTSPIWNSPPSSPNNPFSGRGIRVEPQTRLQRISTKSPKWEPFLDTIRERSFNRRSESDLQEKNLKDIIESEREGGVSRLLRLVPSKHTISSNV